MQKWSLIVGSTFSLALSFLTFPACNAADPRSEEVLEVRSPQSPTLTASRAAAPTVSPRKYKIGALIYNGVATATGDAEAITTILDAKNITYQTANSDEFNAMTMSDLTQYGMIIWPGGYAGQMTRSLTPRIRTLIREAVNNKGVSFVGICAGAFIAVNPAPRPGEEAPDYGLSIISSEELPYYHLENEGTEYSMVDLTLADGKTRSVVWWGGPYLPEYPKGVVARYSDTKQAAIVQTMAGKGMVILAGPHPEAPRSWRTKLGLYDPDGGDYDIAWSMFEAALNRVPLPVLN